MSPLRVFLRQLPIPLAGALVGGVVLGAVGGLVGLILGLNTYVPTAWFAVLEIGIPGALIGGLLGFCFGLVAQRIAAAANHGAGARDNAATPGGHNESRTPQV